ncbi:hypothetical protein CPJCM30710_31750 [Clostridium polyendosporum]|uniref:Branched-chain amino acid transport system ATP-binding protein n=1 Tax=Clostridium polyendosporum TaxID=69208 RepID=A0A919VFN9_9CLOT|nr:hypothetical protein CPJCM30710_31750 [Clostridium polyendosporum]
MLAIGRALLARPKLLMMSEPSLGPALIIVQDIFNIIKEVHRQGVTILLVEQNANLALKVADYGYVMETGKMIIEGSGKDLINNEDIKKAYLGEAVQK